MQVIDQKRITLLSLMEMAEGDLDARYNAARVLAKRLEEDGWFGGSGKSSKPSRTSPKRESRSASSDRSATKRQVQRVIDLDDTYNVEDLEAMSYDEARDLILKLK